MLVLNSISLATVASGHYYLPVVPFTRWDDVRYDDPANYLWASLFVDTVPGGRALPQRGWVTTQNALSRAKWVTDRYYTQAWLDSIAGQADPAETRSVRNLVSIGLGECYRARFAAHGSSETDVRALALAREAFTKARSATGASRAEERDKAYALLGLYLVSVQERRPDTGPLLLVVEETSRTMKDVAFIALCHLGHHYRTIGDAGSQMAIFRDLRRNYGDFKRYLAFPTAAGEFPAPF